MPGGRDLPSATVHRGPVRAASEGVADVKKAMNDLRRKLPER
ncbi:hypothetical protein ACFYXC_36345 [Streptomyces sp. NPDC002701]